MRTGGLACSTQVFSSCQEDFSLHEIDQIVPCRIAVELSLDKVSLTGWLGHSLKAGPRLSEG